MSPWREDHNPDLFPFVPRWTRYLVAVGVIAILMVMYEIS